MSLTSKESAKVEAGPDVEVRPWAKAVI
jgi:hypothetical protein